MATLTPFFAVLTVYSGDVSLSLSEKLSIVNVTDIVKPYLKQFTCLIHRFGDSHVESVVFAALEQCVFQVDVDQSIADVLMSKNVLDPHDVFGLVVFVGSFPMA